MAPGFVGVARVSREQLLQLFMTLGFAALPAGETADAMSLPFAAAVVATVAARRHMPVHCAD